MQIFGGQKLILEGHLWGLQVCWLVNVYVYKCVCERETERQKNIDRQRKIERELEWEDSCMCGYPCYIFTYLDPQSTKQMGCTWSDPPAQAAERWLGHSRGWLSGMWRESKQKQRVKDVLRITGVGPWRWSQMHCIFIFSLPKQRSWKLCVESSIQDGAQWPLLPSICTFGGIPSHLIPKWVCDSKGILSRWWISLSRFSCTKTTVSVLDVLSLSLSWIPCPGGSKPPCFEYAQAILWTGAHSEKLETLANTQWETEVY